MMRMEFENSLWLFALLILPMMLLVLRYSLIDNPWLQKAISAFVRMTIIALLVLSLAQSLWVTQSKDVAVLALADLSDSVSDSSAEQLNEFLGRLQERASNPSKAGLVVFASGPETVLPVDHHPKFPDIEKPESGRSETSIAKALSYAWQMMPSDTINRLALFSDGNETSGDALAEAKRGAAHGFQVYAFPYEADEKDEALLEDLIVPPEVKKGQSFNVTAVAHAVADTSATFTLYRDGFKAQEKELTLNAGENTLTFQETRPGEGLTKYELRMDAKRDFFADNNVSSGIVHISGEPKALYLEGKERDARYLARALEAENIRVDVREGKGMPGSLEELAAYDAVILSDVPATDVSVRQMQLLRAYVEDLGGGFVMIGGEESFGLGGYYRTAIEDVLPVRMRSEKKKDTPSLAMMLIIDKSGSMSGEKIQLAKEAAIATVELLSDRDYVGVVAFDGEAYWALDLQSAANQLSIIQTIEQIEAGGGTNIYPAMVEAHEALLTIPATFKHAILLTDGQSQPGDFYGVTDQMANEMITVTSVGVGQGADVELLQDIARWGNGRFYFTDDAYDIPQIFTKETMTASKSSLVEEPFLAQVYKPSQVVRALEWEMAPFLYGYVVTSPKATADVMLMTERGDPLLAGWRFGLGKCAAFMSDAKSRWAADWLSWPGYGQFWAQVVRDVMRTSQSRGVETAIALRGSQGAITVDNIDQNGNLINGLDTQAQVIMPDLTIKTIPLAQSAPGRYAGWVAMEQIGSYLIKIRQRQFDEQGEEQIVNDFTRGITISYKPEYRHLSTNEEFLRELAESTGGAYQPSLDEVFAVEDSDAVPTRRRLWPWMLAAALLLFVTDVALRRFDLAGRGLFSSSLQRYG